MKSKRKSNIELLRILAIMMIIVLHFFGGRNYEISANANTDRVMRSLCICGVDIFVLITGYFSLNQDTIKIKKIVSLLIDVAFWDGLGFLLCVFAGWKLFSVKGLIKAMFPILYGARWFVRIYVVLLCLIPFINKTLLLISKSAYKKLLVVMVFIFSIWPSFLPNPPIDDFGFGIVHFVVLYCIAGYIKLHVKKLPSKGLCFLSFALCYSIVLIGSIRGRSHSWAYDYPFVIMEAVSLFMLFQQIDLQSSIVNKLGSCAFAAFLIHTNTFYTVVGYDKLFHAKDLANGKSISVVLAVIGSCLFFYLSAFILESIKRLAFSVTVDRILNAIPFLNSPCQIDNKEETK